MDGVSRYLDGISTHKGDDYTGLSYNDSNKDKNFKLYYIVLKWKDSTWLLPQDLEHCAGFVSNG